jgi:hypothetical protein
MFATVVALAPILAPVVSDLTVRNHLRASFQTGKVLTLTGIGSARPESELGLIVDTGAGFSGQITAGAVDVTGNATVLGLLAGVEYGPMTATSLSVAGIITTVAAATDLFAYQYYVAPVGDDVYGNGTITNPFQTIGKAVVAAEVAAEVAAVAAGYAAAVILCAGTYTENVLLQTGITLSSTSGAVIAGNVLVSIASDTPPSTVTLQGLIVRGSVVDRVDGSPVAHNLILERCTISQIGDASALVVNAAATVHATDCVIRSVVTGTASAPLALFDDDSAVVADRCQFNTTASAITDNYVLINQTGVGSMNACVCTLYVETVDASTIAASVLSLDSGQGHTVAACTFTTNYDIVVNGPSSAGDLAGIRVAASTAAYLLGNTFNVSSYGSNINGAAVANDGVVTTDSANVSLADSLTGIAGAGTVVTPTPF